VLRVLARRSFALLHVVPSLPGFLAAGEIEKLVMAQVRALLRQPEIVVGTWQAARAEAPDLTEDEVRDALRRLDPLWDECSPASRNVSCGCRSSG
jgi:hypothetical protein